MNQHIYMIRLKTPRRKNLGRKNSEMVTDCRPLCTSGGDFIDHFDGFNCTSILDSGRIRVKTKETPKTEAQFMKESGTKQ